MSVFQGKSAIVTGGASGIGRAMCEGLSKRGATVTVTDLDGAGAEAVAREIRSRAGGPRGGRSTCATRARCRRSSTTPRPSTAGSTTSSTTPGSASWRGARGHARGLEQGARRRSPRRRPRRARRLPDHGPPGLRAHRQHRVGGRPGPRRPGDLVHRRQVRGRRPLPRPARRGCAPGGQGQRGLPGVHRHADPAQFPDPRRRRSREVPGADSQADAPRALRGDHPRRGGEEPLDDRGDRARQGAVAAGAGEPGRRHLGSRCRWWSGCARCAARTRAEEPPGAGRTARPGSSGGSAPRTGPSRVARVAATPSGLYRPPRCPPRRPPAPPAPPSPS